MSKEPLWTDAKIKALTVLAANTVDPQARWMHEQIAKDMRNDYERALAFRNEDIGRLQGELKQAMARNAALEAQVAEVQAGREKDVALAQAGNMLMQARIAELERLLGTAEDLIEKQAQKLKAAQPAA